MKTDQINNIAILGAGKIGQAIAKGMKLSGKFSSSQITLTRKNITMLGHMQKDGFNVTNDNLAAITSSQLIIISVGPQDIVSLLNEIKAKIHHHKHMVVSTVAGVTIESFQNVLGMDVPIIRSIPNTAVEICESMTCIAGRDDHFESINTTKSIFDSLGRTHILKEEVIGPATALCGSGLAFFLRAIRAASHGGIEIGFHAEDAILLAAQTARGAASLTIRSEMHPESEIDKVTTPKGITISGLNEMEHQGFSSAIIRAIVRASDKVGNIF